MRILFLHPNFPAQFKNLLEAFAKRGDEVKFLCQTHYDRSIKGITRVTLKNKCGSEYLESLKPSIIQRTQILGDQYRNAFLQLKSVDWNPELIISHSGWGCGLHAKEIWPNVKMISYLEWWFCPRSSFFSYDQKNRYLNLSHDNIKKSWLRNQHLSLELSVSDAIVSPTQWQKQQLPLNLNEKCQVIFDGVNIDDFNEKKRHKSKSISTITYGTRGMDPMRCFPQFIKELPNLLEHFPHCEIQIAGENKAYYGYQAPEGWNSWEEWAKDYLENRTNTSRIIWLGKLSMKEYTAWIHRSDCHIYLTHPFVASWSLVEAYCSGVPLIVSDVEPVREICGSEPHTIYVDHRDKDFLYKAVSKAISVVSRTTSLRNPKKFGIETAINGWAHVAGVDLTTDI